MCITLALWLIRPAGRDVGCGWFARRPAVLVGSSRGVGCAGSVVSWLCVLRTRPLSTLPLWPTDTTTIDTIDTTIAARRSHREEKVLQASAAPISQRSYVQRAIGASHDINVKRFAKPCCIISYQPARLRTKVNTGKIRNLRSV